jgi:hypothetical protein
MRKAKLRVKGGQGEIAVCIEVNNYCSGGGLAVSAMTEEGELYTPLSVNLPTSRELPADCWYGKHWTENEGMLEQLVEQGVIELAADVPEASSGFVQGIRAYRLRPEPVVVAVAAAGMSKAFAAFILLRPFGFITTGDVAQVMEFDRLAPLLVRCGQVRFTCGAQYLARMIEMITEAGDYVRDVSFPAGVINEARQVAASAPDFPAGKQLAAVAGDELPLKEKAVGVFAPVFDESECGGAFNGFTVVSDADPGL